MQDHHGEGGWSQLHDALFTVSGLLRRLEQRHPGDALHAELGQAVRHLERCVQGAGRGCLSAPGTSILQVLDGLPDVAVLVFDRRHRLVEAGGGELAAFGIGDAQRGCWIGAVLPAVAASAVAGCLIRALQGERATTGLEIHERSYALTCAPASGERQLAVACFWNCSELHAARRSVERSEQLALVGSLAGGIAHEFNNLNAVVLGNVQRLLRREGMDDDDLRRLRLIAETVRRGSTITRTLLGLMGDSAEELRTLDLCELTRSTVELVRGRLQRAGIALECSLPAEACHVRGDAAGLGQVLLNLLLNAEHALAGIPAPMLRVQLGRQDDRLRLLVQDNGCGMGPETRREAFRPFFTTKGAYASRSEDAGQLGAGLGLPLCESIVARCGGRIELESAVGVGSRFTVVLPACTADGQAPDPLPGRTALIVVGEQAPRLLLRTVLEEAGCRVRCAECACEAEAALEEQTPDLVLLDWDELEATEGRRLAARLAASAPSIFALLAEDGRSPEPGPLPLAGVLRRPFVAQLVRDGLRAGLAARR